MVFTVRPMTASLGAAILLFCASARAQWLKYKTPDVPRLADGKPNLAAPRPGMPDDKLDFSGVWQTDTAKAGETSEAKEFLKAQQWEGALANKRHEELFKDSAGITCLPSGPMVEMGVGRAVQTPEQPTRLSNLERWKSFFRQLPLSDG